MPSIPERISISGGLYFCLLTIFVEVAGVQYLPAHLAKIARQDAWLAVMVAGLFGLLVGLLALWVTQMHPGKPPVVLAREAAGRWVGWLAGLVYVLYFTWLLSLVIRNVVDFCVLVLLPGTPGRVLTAIIAATALYAAWHGLEPIARLSFQVIAAVFGTVAVLPLLVAPDLGLLERSPLLQYGLAPVVDAGVSAFHWFGDALIVLTLGAHLNPKARGWRWTVAAVLAATLLLGLLVALTTLLLGPNLPSRFVFPVYVVLQQISIAQIVERIELVLVAVWISGMVVKMALALYAASEGAGQLLGLRNHRWAAAVLVVVAGFLAHIWRGALDLAWANTQPWFQGGMVAVQAGLPALLLMATAIRRLLRPKGRSHVEA